VLARLDRIYLFQATGNTTRITVSYKICGDSAWSDHLPVEATIELEAGTHQKSWWQMSSYWLEEAEQELKDLWSAQPRGKSFFSKICTNTRYYKNFCKEKVREFREEELSLRDTLEKAKSAL
jgi:hypothetical protein